MACSDQQSDMYPLVLGAVLEACRNNRESGSQAREDLQKEKERREAAAASNAKLQDMVERVMQDAQSAYIKCAARPANLPAACTPVVLARHRGFTASSCPPNGCAAAAAGSSLGLTAVEED